MVLRHCSVLRSNRHRGCLAGWHGLINQVDVDVDGVDVMEIFELRIWYETKKSFVPHTVCDTERHAREAAEEFGFNHFMIQPRRVMGAKDLLAIGEPD